MHFHLNDIFVSRRRQMAATIAVFVVVCPNITHKHHKASLCTSHNFYGGWQINSWGGFVAKPKKCGCPMAWVKNMAPRLTTAAWGLVGHQRQHF